MFGELMPKTPDTPIYHHLHCTERREESENELLFASLSFNHLHIGRQRKEPFRNVGIIINSPTDRETR